MSLGTGIWEWGSWGASCWGEATGPGGLLALGLSVARSLWLWAKGANPQLCGQCRSLEEWGWK